MKNRILNGLVLGLLLGCSEQVDGLKLMNVERHRVHAHHGKRGQNSEDADADDQDITDGPIKNDSDVAIYQDTFMSSGQNVHSLNQQAERENEKKIICDGGACNTALDGNLTPNMAKAYAQMEQQEQVEKPKPKSEYAQPSPQQKRQMYAQEHPARLADTTHTQPKTNLQLDVDDRATNANTSRWATARDVDVGEIETVQTGVSNGYLSVTDANDMLHAVVQSSQKEQYDSAHPSQLQKTDEDLHRELIAQAEEVETQSEDLEHMTYSAKDLSAFTTMTQGSIGRNYPEPSAPQAPAPVAEKAKNFYEQLYAKTA